MSAHTVEVRPDPPITPTSPRRLQLSRRKGYRKPEGAINCARPGPYGNPIPWKGGWITWVAVALGYRGDEAGRKACAVALHRAWLLDRPVEVVPLSGAAGSIEYSDGSSSSFEEAARGFALWGASFEEPPVLPERPDLEPLRGHDLLCWCKPEDPCHVDTLIEAANR